MAGFLYFIPGATPASVCSPEGLLAAGLGHVDSGRGIMAAQISVGPSGSAGVLFKANLPDGGREPATRYVAAEQTWRAGREARWHVGYWNARPPELADLERERMVAGERVRLLDGREWLVPVARSLVRGSTLPRRLMLGEDGQSWSMRELPQYARLCAGAERVWEAFENPAVDEQSGRGIVQFDWEELIEIAVEALGVNYRIAAPEADLLGILGTEEVWEIARAIIDRPALERMAAAMAPASASATPASADQKKREGEGHAEAEARVSGTSTTAAGEAGSCLTTAPPSRT